MRTFIALLLCVLALPAAGQRLTGADVVIDEGVDGGYHLYVRAEGFGSVLLTESTADPRQLEAVYALRNPDYHPVNGDEQRMLDGEFLDSAYSRFSIIDSNPEPHPDLGEAFHLYVPYVVVYGNPWGRSGELQILDGAYLNIRTFPEPYGDYRGGFADNPFVLRLEQRVIPGPPEGNFMEATVESYTDIAERGGGEAIYSLGEEDVITKLDEILDGLSGRSLDLVLALDTTKSMENDIPHLRADLVPMLREKTVGFDEVRLGLVQYKDYMEEYVTKNTAFDQDFGTLQAAIDRVVVRGGRDIPEAVYEALYAGVEGFDWRADTRIIVLVGDAPPHPRPRGSVTEDMVHDRAAALGIELYTIILPQ
jgi:hypothetical protein